MADAPEWPEDPEHFFDKKWPYPRYQLKNWLIAQFW